VNEQLEVIEPTKWLWCQCGGQMDKDLKCLHKRWWNFWKHGILIHDGWKPGWERSKESHAPDLRAGNIRSWLSALGQTFKVLGLFFVLVPLGIAGFVCYSAWQGCIDIRDWRKKKKEEGSMKPMEKKPAAQYPSEVCRICGCTDERGCMEGCAWANLERTLCTSCCVAPSVYTK
jgi:hypothetical protein